MDNNKPDNKGERKAYKPKTYGGKPNNYSKSDRPAYSKPKFDGQTDRPAYNKPKFDGQKSDRPVYNKPKFDGQTDRPVYNKPKFDGQTDRPTYSKPKFDGQKSDRPAYSKPKFDGQTDRPTYNKPKFDGQKTDRPVYNKPKFDGQTDRPTYNKPKFDGQKSDRPTYSKPKFDGQTDRPTYSKPKTYGKPSYSKPAYNKMLHNKPFSDAKPVDSDTAAARHDEQPAGMVIGRNAVRELLKSGRDVDKLFVRKGDREGSITVLVAEAIARGIPVVEAESAKLDTLAMTAHHQGVVAMAAEKAYVTVDEILDIAKQRNEVPLVVVADGIEDPNNLGALIRCMECVGAHGLIIPKRRAVGLTPAVTKSSAGAIEHIAVAKVVNIAATLDTLKEAGLWIFGAEAGGEAYYDCDFKTPAAIVFGSEGEGLSRLVTEKCDFITSIPMYGQLNSLNVSTAAAVILSEAAKQRRK